MNEKMNEKREYRKIDFKAVVEKIDWTKGEVSTRDLVEVVNRESGLTGHSKYMAKTAATKGMLKKLETFFDEHVEKKIKDGDFFYYNPKVLAEVIRKKEEEKKEEPVFVQPITSVAKEEPKKKRGVVFPDEEALEKAEIVLDELEKGGGKTDSSNITSRTTAYKRQRLIAGKKFTVYQETNKLLDFFEISGNVNSVSKKFIRWDGTIESLKTALSAIRDLMGKPKEPEPSKEETEVKVEEVKATVEEKPEPVTKKPLSKKRARIIKSSTKVGSCEFREMPSTVTPYESIREKWNKALIGELLNRATQGTVYFYADMSIMLKKHRYVDLSAKEIRVLAEGIKDKFPGIFRTEENRLIIGSTAKLAEFEKMYQSDQIYDEVYIRLHQSMSDLEEQYPVLKIEIASPISENDNIYRICVNRSESSEKAFAKLIYCIRPGEVVLVSKNHWTIRRACTIIEKSGMDIYNPYL